MASPTQSDSDLALLSQCVCVYDQCMTDESLSDEDRLICFYPFGASMEVRE